MKNHIKFPSRSILARYHPSAFLLAAQLFSLVLYILLEGYPGGRTLLGAFGLLVLSLVVWVISRSSTVRRSIWIIAAPAFLMTLLSALIENSSLLLWSSLLEAVLYFYAAGGLILYMMGDNRVTVDELFAAGATFTLLAWGFAYLYQVNQAWFPGSILGGTDPTGQKTFLELLSLSFTNLSATGLGDIMPSNSLGRVLVMLEQFSGIAYVATVVSRLIGLTISDRKSKGKSG